MKQLYEVKNKLEDERRFHDTHSGRWVVVKPKKSVLSTAPPTNSVVWIVKLEEKKETTIMKEKKNILRRKNK